MNYDNSTVRFYYIRDDFSDLVGCVCLIREKDNTFHRGISICNWKKGDIFVKRTGRAIAYSRALKAKECFETDMFDQFGYAANASMVPLSEEMIEKFDYIQEIYGLGGLKDSKNRVILQKLQAKVDLTDREKKMWEDHLNPNWVRKDKTSSEQV